VAQWCARDGRIPILAKIFIPSSWERERYKRKGIEMANNHIPAGETIADRCWLSFLLLLVSYRKIGEKRNVMCASSHTRKRSVNPISVGKVINLHSNLISVVLVASGPGPGLYIQLARSMCVTCPCSYRMQRTSKESNYSIASLHSRVSFFYFFFL
jgi:hypothetical protein